MDSSLYQGARIIRLTKEVEQDTLSGLSIRPRSVEYPLYNFSADSAWVTCLMEGYSKRCWGHGHLGHFATLPLGVDPTMP